MSGQFLQASEVKMPDGSTFMEDEYGATVQLETLECDACDATMLASERWNCWAWAAGSGYWAQVMWVCSKCGPDMGAAPFGEHPLDFRSIETRQGFFSCDGRPADEGCEKEIRLIDGNSWIACSTHDWLVESDGGTQ